MTHDSLWAPWRLAYVQAGDRSGPAEAPRLDYLPGADPACFLCQAAADPDDRGRWVVCRPPGTIVVLNRYPYNNGHLLVAPARHVGRLQDLADAEQAELSRGVTQMVVALEQALRPHGFNVGLNLGRAAGAGLPGHLHWHIVPRWSGDTNFMPVLADLNVIPQSLDALWELLRRHAPHGLRESG